MENVIYSSPEIGAIVWWLIAVTYIALLMCYTHIDLFFSPIDTDRGIIGRAIYKHSQIITMISNFGLLLFLVIDVLLTFCKHISKHSLILILVTSFFCFLSTILFSLGFTYAKFEAFAVIQCGMGAMLSWLMFFCSLVLLKYKSLRD